MVLAVYFSSNHSMKTRQSQLGGGKRTRGTLTSLSKPFWRGSSLWTLRTRTPFQTNIPTNRKEEAGTKPQLQIIYPNIICVNVRQKAGSGSTSRRMFRWSATILRFFAPVVRA